MDILPVLDGCLLDRTSLDSFASACDIIASEGSSVIEKDDIRTGVSLWLRRHVSKY
jgi:hypothetical protein